MDIESSDTAVVVIDPQNDVLNRGQSPPQDVGRPPDHRAGFEVALIRDATAGPPRRPARGDGYQAALVNYAFLAHAVLSTAGVVAAMAVSTEGAT